MAAIKKTKKPAKKSKFPFPFFGAGDAHYYEWFEMYVWFVTAPAKSARAKLVKMAPELCRMDAQWPRPEVLWASTGDQWIQMHLVEAYGTPKAKKTMARAMKKQMDDPYGGDDDDLDDLLAMGGEEQKFNKDIDAWLLALHQKQPILFAARREDGEAGGTKLSAWHTASLGMADTVLPTFEKLAAKPLKKDDLARSIASIVVGYIGADKVKPAVRKLVLSDEG